MITSMQAARLIDISAVRTPHTRSDIEQLVKYAKAYRFINVHVLPNWVKLLAELLKEEPDVYVGAPVGFPSGGHKTEIKLAEAKHLAVDGVQEMDIMMNVGRFLNKEYDYVLDELTQIIRDVPKGVLTKVIIEINVLNDAEMKNACALVIESGADFVKTGTGWVPGDANIGRIRAMKEVCGDKIKIKAAGGIRTPQEFLELYDMGVARMGINTKSALEIVEHLKAYE
ncbi:MAG: deoxyribose-phosphate aldolase [Oscillospiraceae bacterium]|nr:deoxyribose-phosphate aldolase [Oscillospiraceae bacterium]